LNGVIMRGKGLTPSEQKLAALADRTFLRLWSYPNTFNDRTKSASGEGQEVADLLAVFEKHVVLFSDKVIAWQADKHLSLAWCRWYRRAVDGAIKQLVGASRWLDLHPDRIFTDKQCLQQLPIPLPPKEERIVHLVAVVSGANAASCRYFNNSRGTFMIRPGLKGKMHLETEQDHFHPFVIGDPNPDGSFVHVFDPAGLEFVMQELDTVPDFTSYLVERSRFLRSGQLLVAAGEDDLLAVYMMNGFINGRPGFVPQKLRVKAQRRRVAIPEGEYETYVSSRLYAEIASLKQQSMLWDEIIEMISDDVLKGTSISILDVEPSVQLSESALRVMASEKRMDRVKLAQALGQAMGRSLDEKLPRLVRRVLISRMRPNRKIGYIFLLLPHDEAAGTYEEYRQYRSSMLSTYGLSFFREQPKLDVVVSIALDLYKVGGEIRTRSEDVIAMEAPDRTPGLSANLEANRALFELKHPRDLEGLAIRQKIRNPLRPKSQRGGRNRF
jgi:hypothetical protein